MTKVVGPTLPPGFDRDQTPDDHDQEDVGPAPPPPSGLQDQEDQVTRATRQFLEREQRHKQAQEETALAAERTATSRPDWMLSLPTHTRLQKLVGDPTQLKSRGFSQTLARVQRKPTVGNGQTDSELWTETPEQKSQRLRDEVDGKRARGEDKLDHETELRRELERRRDQAIQKSIQGSRGASLLEQHKAKRREHVKDKSHRRHRDRSRSPESSSRRRHQHSNSTRDGHRDKRSRRYRHDDKQDKHRRRNDIESQDEEESRRKKKQEGSVPVMWDRDAALSVGGKLMHEKSRDRLIQDAAELANRFGSASSRFL